MPMHNRRVTKVAKYSGARGREEFNVRVSGMAYSTHSSMPGGVKKSKMKIPTVRTTVRLYSARKDLRFESSKSMSLQPDGETNALLVRVCFPLDFRQFSVERLPVDA